MIKHFGPNLIGRDFVCGDIHGCFDLVESFLNKIGFDKTKDRLFSVGDLVDRGPFNERCLDLLYQPWFHMVKGNHDFMMSEGFRGDSKYGMVWLNHGGLWAVNYLGDSDEMSIYVRGAVEDIINKLPLLITVQKKDGSKFHVMHAELTHDEHLTDDDLADEHFLKQLATRQTRDGDFILWARNMFIRFHDRHLDERAIAKIKKGIVIENKNVHAIFNPKLSHIYSGHTVVRAPIQFYGQTDLDTMAYGSYAVDKHSGKKVNPWAGLTFTEPATGKFWKVAGDQFTEIKPIVII